MGKGRTHGNDVGIKGNEKKMDKTRKTRGNEEQAEGMRKEKE